jgi:hypothetical protein
MVELTTYWAAPCVAAVAVVAVLAQAEVLPALELAYIIRHSMAALDQQHLQQQAMAVAAIAPGSL